MEFRSVSSIIIFSLILGIIIYIELKRKTKIDFLLIYNISYAMFFSIIPIATILFPDTLNYGVPANWSYHFETYHKNLLASAIFALSFYIVFVLTTRSLEKKTFALKRIKNNIKYIENDKIFILGIVFLLVGIGSFFIYSTTMGGPVNAIRYAQLKRSGVYETTGAVTFFKHFIRSVYFALFVFLTVNSSNNKFKSIKKILLVISIVFSIIALLVYSGRANIIILLTAILLHKGIVNGNVNKKQFVSFGVIFVAFTIILVFYRPFMLFLSGREVTFAFTDFFASAVTGIIKAFSVPIISLMVAIEYISINEISFGTGFLQIFIDVIPKSIIGTDLVYTVNNYNTELFGFKLDSRMYNINAGLLAYFFYEFYWMGVVIGGAITALVIKILDDWLMILKSNSTLGLMMVYFLFNLPNRILAGDQVGGIKSLLILYLELMALIILVYKSKKSNVLIEPNDG
ncbi:MAG TPA: hypothetical protein DCG38_01475 [Eubacteriaceae bacterium]|nr:hypothetical protein [Eubacteriaceae bacterium]